MHSNSISRVGRGPSLHGRGRARPTVSLKGSIQCSMRLRSIFLIRRVQGVFHLLVHLGLCSHRLWVFHYQPNSACADGNLAEFGCAARHVTVVHELGNTEEHPNLSQPCGAWANGTPCIHTLSVHVSTAVAWITNTKASPASRHYRYTIRAGLIHDSNSRLRLKITLFDELQVTNSIFYWIESFF